MSKLKVLELFGGIGACSKALERLGIDYEIADYVEIDKYAVKSFNAMHGTNFEPQDICKWNKDIECDLIMHGSPCQDFSLAGKQAGGDEGSGTRSSLMYETVRIVEKLKPKYVIWENVKNVISKKHKHNFDNYLNKMDELGYKNYWQVLNAKDYGIPQNRERVFTISVLNGNNYKFPDGADNKNKINRLFNFSARQDCRVVYDENGLCPTLVAGMGEGGGKVPMFIDKGFNFPPKQELKLKLKDMLEDNVDEKYYLSEKMIEYISPTLDTMQGGYRQPCIEDNNFVANKYNEFIQDNGYIPEMFNPYNKKEIKEIAPTQTTYCNSNTSSATILIKNATKQGYLEAYEGDSVNLLYPTSNTRRGRVGEQVSQTLQCNDSMGVIEKNKYSEESLKRIKQNIIKNDIANTLTANAMQSFNHNNCALINNNLRIRKLTPKECWRLMGFDDEDFEKAEKVNSNTQLYKQAGNSIVVNVLVAIFKELFTNLPN